jgi:hypothetical protein
MKFLNDLFTGVDNCTFDIARVLWAVCVISFVVFSGVDLYLSGEFKSEFYAIGAGGLLFGGGAGVWIKKDAEPSVK